MAGVTEYCDKVPASWLVTKIQLSSERIAIEVGFAPVVTTAGVANFETEVYALDVHTTMGREAMSNWQRPRRRGRQR